MPATPYAVSVTDRTEIRRRRDGTTYEVTRWTARCTVEGRNGQRVQVSAGTRQEALRRLQRRRDDVLADNPARRGNPTVATWMTDWVYRKKGGHPNRWRTSTAVRNRQHVSALLEYCPEFGKLRLVDVRQSDVSQAVQELAAKTDHASLTVRHCHAVMRVGFRDAIGEGLIKSNPAASVIMPKLKPRRPAFFTLNEEQLFIKEALHRDNGIPRYRYGRLLVLLLLTGMRSGEIRCLRRSDIVGAGNQPPDLHGFGETEGLTIKVTRSLSVGRVENAVKPDDFHGLHEGSPKSTAGERDIRVSGLAADILKALLLELEQELPKASNPLLFPGVEGGYLQPRILGAEFQAVVQQCARYPAGREFERWVCPDLRPGEKRWLKAGERPAEYPDAVVDPSVCKRCGSYHLRATVHSLRHSAISRWVNEQDVTVWAAAKRAGHKSVYMVVETYSHSTDEADKSVALKDWERHKGLKVDP